MVQNDQRSEAREGVCIANRAPMDRANRRVLGGRDFNSVLDGAASQTPGRLAERSADLACDGPFERSAEGKQRNRDRFGGPSDFPFNSCWILSYAT
jgi:hypothetical protein